MCRQPSYEVFLSFRGPDTRQGFADFLRIMLTNAQIPVFWDDKELKRGKEIGKGLIEAIEQSKISIPIISRNYASSKSCLMELKQMLECSNKKRHVIYPIFYYVRPCDVRSCSGHFATSLLEHKKSGINDNIVDSWKSALQQVGKLHGHHLHRKSKVTQGQLIEQIVREVQRMLKKENLMAMKQLVGVDSHVQGIRAKLEVDDRHGQAVKTGDPITKVLVIHGIPGVGKTVLAKHVYHQLYHLYEACSVLEEIQAKIESQGVVSVQNDLISDLLKGDAQKFHSYSEALNYMRRRFSKMKVLVLLDDVNDSEQRSKLVGELDWLCKGSRVILTSQTKDVIRNIEGAESYLLGQMKKDEALILFCRHAFRMDYPHKGFEKLSKKIVAAIDGLPLALKLVGSSLFSVKTRKRWKDRLAAVTADPCKGVQEALMKIYTNLDKERQQIFLDIACFFVGKDKRIPYYMWRACKYDPYDSILDLCARSFVQIGEDKELCMPEILKKFGQNIVKDEDMLNPCKRSRLYDHKEALRVLEGKMGTDRVLALGLDFGDELKKKTRFKYDRFDPLQNLRFLKLDQADIRGNFGDRLPNLMWLDWQGCPKIFEVESLNLNVQKLVILDLSWSQVDKGWRGWELLVQARKLKVLKLTGCVQLTATPTFPPMKLERLILEGCSRLAVVHRSVSNLEKLVSLNMKQCRLLNQLPNLSPMRGLRELVIDGTSISEINFQEDSMMKLKTLSACDCQDLTEISNSIGYLKSLKHLALDNTKIHTLQFIGSLDKLKTLSLKNCRSLCHPPDGIEKLRLLEFLDLSDTLIKELPPSVEDLKFMKVLRMKGTFIKEFPGAILKMKKLQEIDLSLCPNLEGAIPYSICRLLSLEILKLSDTRISRLPSSFRSLSRLQELDVFRCNKLRRLPKLPSSCINVRWH